MENSNIIAKANAFFRVTKKIEVGDKFIINKIFSNISGEGDVVSISPSGQWFRVSGCYKSFSTKTLHSRGFTLVSGYYLIPVK
jgi:hypothetical protein